MRYQNGFRKLFVKMCLCSGDFGCQTLCLCTRSYLPLHAHIHIDQCIYGNSCVYLPFRQKKKFFFVFYRERELTKKEQRRSEKSARVCISTFTCAFEHFE